MVERVTPPERQSGSGPGAAVRSRATPRPAGRGGKGWGALALLVLAGLLAGTGVGAAESWNGEGGPVLSPSVSDSFSHKRHERLACMTCHLSSSGSMLTFQPPRGCQICHHVDQARNGCAQCHEAGSVPDTIAVHVQIAAAGDPPLDRAIPFRHERHAALQCRACHGQPVTMEPTDSALTCRGCHAEHHESGRTCATCHRTERITQAHAPPVQAHVACDRCHTTAAIAPLTPTRSFCLVCHAPSVDHHPARECVACHLQASPAEYRPLLLK